MKIKGWGGSLEILDDCVIIRRTYVVGLFQHGLKGEKRIPYSSISALQCKRPGFLNGYIQFTIAGGVESTKGIIAAAEDENSLQFINGELFDKAKAMIEERLSASRRISSPAILQTSAVEQLEKLASLLDRGLVTDEEFRAQKRTLLGKTDLADGGSLGVVPTNEVNDSVEPEPPMPEYLRRAIEEHRSAQTKQPKRDVPTFGKRVSR